MCVRCAKNLGWYKITCLHIFQINWSTNYQCTCILNKIFESKNVPLFSVSSQMGYFASSDLPKAKSTNGDIFYFLNQATWYSDLIESALYEDPVQEAVYTAIHRAIIKMFGLFEWKLDQDAGKYFPKLPLPQQGCIYKVIDAVKKEIARQNLEYTNETEKLEELGINLDGQKKVSNRLPHIWSRISTGFLAWLALNLTSTFAVCKN